MKPQEEETAQPATAMESFPDLVPILEKPTSEILLPYLSLLQQFTDLAIDLMEEEGLTLALSGWECLRTHSETQKDFDLLCQCLYCESNIYAGRGESFHMQANIIKSATAKLPKESPSSGETDPVADLVEEYKGKARSCWIKQREMLYRLNVLDVQHEPRFESAFLCNYGNCLSHVGRTSEAINHWRSAMQLDANNLAAYVAYAQGCMRLARYFPRHSILLLDEAFLALSYALESKINVERYWDLNVIDSGRRSLAELLEWQKSSGVDATAIKKRIEKRDRAHKNFQPLPHVERIGKLGLLLSVIPRPLSCSNTARDEAFPESLGYRTLKGQRRLLNLLNSIKEDYSLGRFLLFQYLRVSKPLVTYSSLTDYAKEPSTNEFGLRPGLIRSVVRTAIDALDRVAKVLEILLELPEENPRRPLSFNTIWYKNRDKKLGLRDEIRGQLEFGSPVLGLYDIHLAYDVEEGPLKTLRDLFVHDVGDVTGYARILKVKRPNSDEEEELDLLSLALESLHILKGAFLMLCQVSNSKYHGKMKGDLRSYETGRSLSDRLDLGESLD